jgi:hypothetical protein
MSYVEMPDAWYGYAHAQGTAYGTPGWQTAPVPGWGVNTDFSTMPSRVGVGSDKGHYPEDNELPRYTQVRETSARQLFQGKPVGQRPILPVGARTANPPGFPIYPHRFPGSRVYSSSTFPHYAAGGGSDIRYSGRPLGGAAAADAPAYGIGELSFAIAGGIVGGMLLTYLFYSTQMECKKAT